MRISLVEYTPDGQPFSKQIPNAVVSSQGSDGEQARCQVLIWPVGIHNLVSRWVHSDKTRVPAGIAIQEETLGIWVCMQALQESLWQEL
mmetsp:Transcript_36321/g.64613  ORF Transcript_36321/g.64613 Transcript_36321/m.64613 type:complete len:89 (+) Transcript_36321:411-677(+)